MRIRTLVALFVLFVSFVITNSASASCSLATVKGNYGYYHGRPGGGSTVTAVVGQIDADGAGTLSGLFIMSVNGTISNGVFNGTYSVAANCTGTLTFSSEDTTNAHFNIVLDDKHAGFQMIQTDSGFAQPGFGLAQGTTVCGLTGKKATFAINLLGELFPSLDFEAVVGQIDLNGLGAITGNAETVSLAGIITTGAVNGAYTESGSCLGTMSIAGPTTMNFTTVSVNDGKELLMIETDSGTLVTGTAQQ